MRFQQSQRGTADAGGTGIRVARNLGPVPLRNLVKKAPGPLAIDNDDLNDTNFSFQVVVDNSS